MTTGASRGLALCVALCAIASPSWARAQTLDVRRSLVHAPYEALARLAGAPVADARDAFVALDSSMGATPVPRFAAYEARRDVRVLIVVARFSEHEACVREARPADEAALVAATRACRAESGSFEKTAVFIAARAGEPLALAGTLPSLDVREANGRDEEAVEGEDPAYMEDVVVTGVQLLDEDGAGLRVVERRTETWIEERPYDYDEEEARGMSEDELEGRVRRHVITIYSLSRTFVRGCRGGPETNLATCGLDEAPRAATRRRSRPRRR